MLVIDGSFGEGGGQILRTALGLSVVTGKPFRIEKVRAGRKRPGLLRQHLTAVNAAAAIGGAHVEGAELGSQSVTFVPTSIGGSDCSFAIGSAGSTMLVLQTVLPALLVTPSPCTVTVEGGTHNPSAPPFEFFAKAFLPLLRRMGANVDVELTRYGFYPAGGGKVVLTVGPTGETRPLELLKRGEVRARHARALAANLAFEIAKREIDVVAEKLGWPEESLQAHTTRDADGPGNVITLELESEHVTEVFTGFGERGVRAEKVAEDAVDEAKAYLAADVPVGPHLADQLLVPMSILGGGSFTTGPPTAHTTTNVEVIRKFLPVEITVERKGRASIFNVSDGGGRRYLQRVDKVKSAAPTS